MALRNIDSLKDLAEGNFSAIEVSRIEFDGTNLSRTNFRRANLTGEVNFYRASFALANLNLSKFNRADS